MSQNENNTSQTQFADDNKVKKDFVEPAISAPVDVLKSTTYFLQHSLPPQHH